MSNQLLELLKSGGDTQPIYVDDVFSSYIYTGNGTGLNIVNGIDLAGKGGLVWTKGRDTAYQNQLEDTIRGASNYIISNDISGQASNPQTITSFNSDGFNLGNNALVNGNLVTFASWTFRKARKFFDIVTYTGNGIARTINHNLDITPGVVIIKRLDSTGNWPVQHITISPTLVAYLNATNQFAAGGEFNNTAATSTVFSVGTGADVNASGGSYVAYLFAHDTSENGIIQCGSFTTDGSGNATVNLGWEPQMVILKASGTTSDWDMLDIMRAWPANSSTSKLLLRANSAGAEIGPTIFGGYPTATGFAPTNLLGSQTYIYIAIRRSNKIISSPSKFYNHLVQNRTGVNPYIMSGIGFTPDLLITADRPTTGAKMITLTRLLGRQSAMALYTSANETGLFGPSDVHNMDMDGDTILSTATALNGSGVSFVNYFFKRAPKIFDMISYTGTGVNKTEKHNLGVIPELWIVKNRTTAIQWLVGSTLFTTLEVLDPSSNAPKVNGGTNIWNSTYPTATDISLGNANQVNKASSLHVAYLFATKVGISKIGLYTGNGSNQTINCGFSTGARFILIKRTDSTGDWFVFDTARGIISGNDPHLRLNSPLEAEITTDDSIDPDTSGFIVNQLAATNLNVTSATYIYLAIA